MYLQYPKRVLESAGDMSSKKNPKKTDPSENMTMESSDTQKARKKRAVLKPHHTTKWVRDSLIARPREFQPEVLNLAFEKQFPDMEKNFLTKGHIEGYVTKFLPKLCHSRVKHTWKQA